MPEWMVSAISAVGGVVGALLVAARRVGSREAEMTSRIDQAAKDAEAARASAAAVGEKVYALDLRGALHDERLTRLHSDLAEIKAILGEVRDRLPPR